MNKLIKLLKKNKGWSVVIGVLFLLLTGSSIYILYALSLLSNIENFLRLCGAGIILVLWFLLCLFIIKTLNKRKLALFIPLIIGMLIYSGILIFAAYNIHKVVGKVGNVTANYTTYSTSLVALSDNEADSLSDIGSEAIGRLNDENSVDGYQIPNDIIKNNKLKNEIVDYDSYVSLLQDLYDGEIEYVFLPTNYGVMFKNIEGFGSIESDTKIIYTEQKKVKKQTALNGKGSVDKPFTILLMGVDSELENIQDSSFNGDALMLLTFNPTTLNTTIMSIPRDTYVPISCFSGQRKNKITHAAWYGEDCMINTIQDFTGITIDYYVKINFKGVVKLVDALGGIEVDVPISFCEQDSDRNFDEMICLEPGVQTLNGEQALALSRHRKTINDFIRGQNQQLVLKGVMNQAKAIDSIDTIYNLLDTISNNMETNMSTSEILSFYNIGKDILLKSKDMNVDELIGMQRLYISGYDAMIYDYSTIHNQGTGLTLYDFVPYDGSISDVVKAMKINLELEEPEMEKTFSFDVDEPYEEIVIGKGEYNESTLALLPNFIGYDQSVAVSYGNRMGIPVNVKTVEGSYGQDIGQILDQSLPEGMDIDYISKSSGFTITVVGSIGSGTEDDEEVEEVNCSLKKNKDDSQCAMPNFIGDSVGAFENWLSSKKYSISVKYKVSVDGVVEDVSGSPDMSGIIIDQSPLTGSLYDVIGGNSLVLTYEVSDDEDDEEIDNSIIDDTNTNIDTENGSDIEDDVVDSDDTSNTNTNTELDQPSDEVGVDTDGTPTA